MHTEIFSFHELRNTASFSTQQNSSQRAASSDLREYPEETSQTCHRLEKLIATGITSQHRKTTGTHVSTGPTDSRHRFSATKHDWSSSMAVNATRSSYGSFNPRLGLSRAFSFISMQGGMTKGGHDKFPLRRNAGLTVFPMIYVVLSLGATLPTTHTSHGLPVSLA
jgi:hypothetical protein